MKRTSFTIIMTILILIIGNAQEVEFGFGLGSGNNTMTDLKNINNKMISSIPFETKIVSNFPPYLYYQPSIILKGKNFGFGICYNFESTGSRVSSQDYSGEYRFDMKIHSNSPCIYAEYDIPFYNNFHVGIYSMAGFVFTNLKINEYLGLIDTILYNTSYKFNVQNFILEPGIEINYKIKFIGIKLNAGYLFQSKDDSFGFNSDPTSNPNYNLNSVKANWNGYRVGLTIFYNLTRKHKTEKVNPDSK